MTLLALLVFLSRVWPISLDQQGPYLILMTERAERDYRQGIAQARQLHPGCRSGRLDLPSLAGAERQLRKVRPRYTLVFLEPDELSADFVWRWLDLTTRLDGDPFVDTRTGFLTGEATAAYFQRLAKREPVPALLVDNLGPGERFQSFPGSWFLPGLASTLPLRSFAHPQGELPSEALRLMAGAGILHLGGHGDPAGVIGGMQAADWKELSPAFVFNGACSGGVTATRPSFCLAALRQRPLAYFASTYPDHGMPVYQELERMSVEGATAGDVIKGTQDEVILGLGGVRFKLAPRPWSASQQMLYGTASRVLFGDPAVRLVVPRARAPFLVGRESATLVNPRLQASLTDTYHGDLCSAANMFNARARLDLPVPQGRLRVTSVQAWGKPLRFRQVAAAVEDGRVLRLQVDVEATGLFQSPFLVPGATVSWSVKPAPAR